MKQKMYSCDARVILSILIGLFLSCNVFAQDVTIKGNVKDAKGEPIIGASILEKGTTNGTVTDFDGNFMLSAPKGSTIGISYIGYKSQDIINQGQSNLYQCITRRYGSIGRDCRNRLWYGEER